MALVVGEVLHSDQGVLDMSERDVCQNDSDYSTTTQAGDQQAIQETYTFSPCEIFKSVLFVERNDLFSDPSAL
jgi:hypothetical protein